MIHIYVLFCYAVFCLQLARIYALVISKKISDPGFGGRYFKQDSDVAFLP